MTFDQVISLGAQCQTAHQIRRRFGREAGGIFERTGSSFDGIVRLIGERAAFLGETLEVHHAGRDIKCSRYQIMYHHEFPRNSAGEVYFSRRDLEKIDQRMSLRIRRFNAALGSNRRTLFVRFCGHNDDLSVWPYTPDPRPITGADFQRLTDAIDTSFPGLPYMIAFAYHPEFTQFDPAGLPGRVIPHAFPCIGIDDLPPEDKWKGCDANWDGLFDRLCALSNQPPAHEAA